MTTTHHSIQSSPDLQAVNKSYQLNAENYRVSLILNVSVDVGVPEQGLVTVTPEELVGSDVLVLVLSGPLLIGNVSHVLSVLGVLLLNLANGDGGQEDGRDSNHVGQFLPQLGDTLGVVSLVLNGLNPLLAGSGVALTGEGVLVDELGSAKRTVGVESSSGELGGSSQHDSHCSERGQDFRELFIGSFARCVQATRKIIRPPMKWGKSLDRGTGGVRNVKC